MCEWFRKQKLPVGLSLALVAVMALALLVVSRSREPVYGGHRLSEWLDAYDTNLRFDEGDGRRQFSDEEIDTALNTIGEKAFPSLLRWITAKDFPYQRRMNALLDGQSWIRFRFTPARQNRCIASTGFMFYGSEAKSLQPALIRMTFSPDPDVRLIAYECFYFSRPDKEVFLPVAMRGLKEPQVADMTAQWLVERFPAEAEKAGMRARFPQFYREEVARTNSAPSLRGG